MTDNSEIIDLLTAIVSTIENQDKQAQTAKLELLEQLKVIASKTDTVSTNFPKLIETLSNFDSKIASSFDDIQSVSKQLDSVVQQVSIAEQAILNVQQQSQKLNLNSTLRSINEADEQAQSEEPVLGHPARHRRSGADRRRHQGHPQHRQDRLRRAYLAPVEVGPLCLRDRPRRPFVADRPVDGEACRGGGTEDRFRRALGRHLQVQGL